MNHSPLPFRVDPSVPYHILDGNGRVIIDCMPPGMMTEKHRAECEGNARIIAGNSDLIEKFAEALCENSRLRHGLFTPTEFRELCANTMYCALSAWQKGAGR